MEELQKDLLEVFEKHDLKILEDSAMLELSPICIYSKSRLMTREVTLRFTEAIQPTDKISEDVKKYGIIIK